MLLGDEKYIFITGRRAVSIGQPWKPDYAAEIGMIEKMRQRRPIRNSVHFVKRSCENAEKAAGRFP